MKIEEMLDIFDIDEIEKMSPEECKGLLKGFFIGAGFIEAFRESVDELIDKRYKKKKTNPYKTYTSSRQDFRNIQLVFETREKAEDTLDELCELLESSKEGYVTVRQLYSIVKEVIEFDAVNWVWYDLDDCTIEEDDDGHYILKMPPAEPKNPYRA